MQLLLLLAFIGLMHAAGSFMPQPGSGTRAAGVTLAAGFTLLCGVFAGNLFKDARLPRLTGYLTIGIIAGPHVLGLLTEQMVTHLRIFNGVAIALIALTAGVEMDFRTMRPLLRGITWITGVAVLGTVAVLSLSAFLMRDLLPFTAGLTDLQVVVLALVLGITMTAQSPAVAVALRNEMQADGPMTRTVLGVVVIADLVIILLFALASTGARRIFGGVYTDVSPLSVVAWEIFGSIGAGLMIGVIVATFLIAAQRSGGLFIVLAGFLVAEVGQRVQLDPLLIALAAGIFIRNFTSFGDRVHADIETTSLPVYVGFFAVAGATIHLDALMVVGIPAATFVLIRAAAFLAGTRFATYCAGSPEVVQRFAGYGLLPQAGLALALALLFARTYPQFGPQASALIFGVVGINEMLAPVLYRWALVRSGEAGQMQPAAADSGIVLQGAAEARPV